jgi:hypothetical protein
MGSFELNANGWLSHRVGIKKIDRMLSMSK